MHPKAIYYTFSIAEHIPLMMTQSKNDIQHQTTPIGTNDGTLKKDGNIPTTASISRMAASGNVTNGSTENHSKSDSDKKEEQITVEKDDATTER